MVKVWFPNLFMRLVSGAKVPSPPHPPQTMYDERRSCPVVAALTVHALPLTPPPSPWHAQSTQRRRQRKRCSTCHRK
jgi:hypothetical protein